MASATRAMARRLGSIKATWRRAFLLGLAVALINLISLAVISLITAQSPTATQALTLLALLVELFIWVKLFRRGFALSERGSWALVGVQFAASTAVVLFQVCVIRPFVIEAFVLPTGAMRPTLSEQDRFISNKFLTPRRWDIVTFIHDAEPRVVYCKRLLGLPGERLRFEGSAVYVNDRPISTPAVYTNQRWLGRRPALRYQDGETITLKPDECFLVGDRLDASSDSRYEGPGLVGSITGVVDWRYWPLTYQKIFR